MKNEFTITTDRSNRQLLHYITLASLLGVFLTVAIGVGLWVYDYLYSRERVTAWVQLSVPTEVSTVSTSTPSWKCSRPVFNSLIGRNVFACFHRRLFSFRPRGNATHTHTVLILGPNCQRWDVQFVTSIEGSSLEWNPGTCTYTLQTPMISQ